MVCIILSFLFDFMFEFLSLYVFPNLYKPVNASMVTIEISFYMSLAYSWLGVGVGIVRSLFSLFCFYYYVVSASFISFIFFLVVGYST